MFKSVIQSNILTDIIAAVSHIQNDIRVNLSPDGLRIETVDPANVAMVSLVAGKAAFDHFEATSGDIAIDISKLGNMINAKGEPVSLELDEVDHKLKVRQGRSSFVMSLIDPSSLKANPRIPAIELPCAVTMQGNDLRDAVRSALKVSDGAYIEQSETMFSIVTEHDIDTYRADFPLAELTGIRMGEARSLFALEYLDDVAKVASGHEVTIESGLDYPARIMLSIGKDIAVSYLLAPRIENTD